MDLLLDRFYAALKALAPEQLSACVSEDFVLNWQGSDAIPWAGTWRGVGGLLAFVDRLNAQLEILSVERLKQLSDGHTCMVLLRGHWRLKATGREVQALACNVFEIERDRIRAYTVLNNTVAFAEALREHPRA